MARMTSTAVFRTGRPASPGAMRVSPDARQRLIREAAYYRYAERGFAHGHDVEDWLAAEADFERAPPRVQLPEAEPMGEFGMQQGGAQGPAEDDALKRIIRGHSRRDIPRIESMEPEDAPRKE